MRQILSLLLCSAVAPLWAFNGSPLSEFTYRSWHVQDGLPDQVVQAIAQTPDSFLWIGTTRGLLRFDGRTFVIYSGPGVDALRHGITCLLVAHDGALYIGTEGGGLLRLQNGVMEQANAKEGLDNPLVRSIFEDRRGTLWVGTDRGLFRQSGRQPGRRFERVETPQEFPNLGSAAVLEDRNGNLWSGGSRLLRIHDGHIQDYVLPLQNGSMRIKALCVGADGSIWVGAVAGLFHQLPDGRFVKVTDVRGSVRTLALMQHGQVWAGTAGDGLYVQRADAPSGDRFHHVTAPDVLPGNTILSLAVDRNGNHWIGTQSGLLRLSRTGMHLIALPRARDSDFGTLMRDSDGSLWICSSQLFHMQNGRTASYRFPQLDGVTVRTMLRERDGALWLGTSGRGAYRIRPDGHVDHYTAEIGTNYIRGFLQSADGSVWIGTDGGVSRFHDGVIGNYHEIAHAPYTLTLSMAEDRTGRLWVGTRRGLATIRDGVFEDPPVAGELRDEAIWSLLSDQDGTLWIGAESGLFRLRDGRLSHIALSAEIPSAAVYQILDDGEGAMWISGPTRVLRISKKALNDAADKEGAAAIAPQVFAVSNEIQAAELYGGMQPAGVLGEHGTAWFPTSQGPLHLIPDELQRPTDVPLLIDHAVVNGRTMDQVRELDLPAGTRTLEIEFAPVLLTSQLGLRFQHRLKGFEDWSVPSFSRMARYTNLPSGRYRFEARVIDSTGATLSSVEIPVRQRAFFYMQPWFWIVALLAAMTFVWFVYRLRVSQIRRRFQAITAERNRLAREMHDTVIQGCIAVSALLEACSGNETAREERLLHLAREQIRSTIREARDTVWNLRRGEAQGHSLEPSLRKLLQQCTQNAGITPKFRCEGSEPELDYATIHELLMSTREALLNATTHSAATRIDLELRCSTAGLSITIADNGSGFNPETAAAFADRHYGLTGMRERIEGLGGAFHLSSSIGEGTQLVFQVPGAILERHRPAGMEV